MAPQVRTPRFKTTRNSHSDANSSFRLIGLYINDFIPFHILLLILRTICLPIIQQSTSCSMGIIPFKHKPHPPHPHPKISPPRNISQPLTQTTSAPLSTSKIIRKVVYSGNKIQSNPFQATKANPTHRPTKKIQSSPSNPVQFTPEAANRPKPHIVPLERYT